MSCNKYYYYGFYYCHNIVWPLTNVTITKGLPEEVIFETQFNSPPKFYMPRHCDICCLTGLIY